MALTEGYYKRFLPPLSAPLEVSVNLLKNSMVASYDEAALDTGQIIQAVEKAGYGAIPKAGQSKPAAERTAGQSQWR